MQELEPNVGSEDFHPIDLAESLAELHAWEFNREEEDRIFMVREGLWRQYGIDLAWSQPDEMLRLACAFDIDPPDARLGLLREVVCLANDRCWTGSFSHLPEKKLMVFRYGLILNGGVVPTSGQIGEMVARSVDGCEVFYPAFQFACWGSGSPGEAIAFAMAETCGRA